MNKRFVFGCLLAVLGIVGFLQTRPAENNQDGVIATIFLKDGSMRQGEIVDISTERQVMEFGDQTEIPMKRILMINFVDMGNDYPEEKAQVKENTDYLFLRDGRVKKGVLVDFSIEQKVFELDNGANYPAGMIKRIYFNKQY
jgi:hypothetical protein